MPRVGLVWVFSCKQCFSNVLAVHGFLLVKQRLTGCALQTMSRYLGVAGAGAVRVSEWDSCKQSVGNRSIAFHFKSDL